MNIERIVESLLTERNVDGFEVSVGDTYGGRKVYSVSFKEKPFHVDRATQNRAEAAIHKAAAEDGVTLLTHTTRDNRVAGQHNAGWTKVSIEAEPKGGAKNEPPRWAGSSHLNR